MSFLLDALTTIGSIIDTPGSMVRNTLAGENPFKGLFQPEERTYGRDLLEKWGALGENEEGLDWGDVAGFGVDVVADPLNLIPGLALAKTGMANRGIRSGNQAMLRESADNFARMGQGVSQANAPSLAMREAGALPEELLPDAIKVYGSAHADDLTPAPGVYNPQLDERGFTPVSRTDPRSLRHQTDMGEINPGLRTLEQGDIKDIGGRLNAALESGSLSPDVAAHIEDGANRAIRLLGSQKPFELGYGTPLPPGIRPEIADDLIPKVLADHEKKVREEFLNMYNPGHSFDQDVFDPNSVSEFVSDAVEELMASEGKQLARRNAMPDIGAIRDTKTLMEEVAESTIPARMASESFYAVPKKPVVNFADEIDTGLVRHANRDLSEAKLAHLEKIAAEKPTTYYDLAYGRTPHLKGEPVYYQLPIEGDGIGAILDPKLPGAHIAPGTDMYLPYVAPALQNRPRWISPAGDPLRQIPNMSALLAAILGENFLTGISRGSN